MAVSKAEVFKVYDDDLKALEKKIDELLMSSRSKHAYNGIWLDASVFGDDRITRDALIEKYREVGWKVTAHDDQRDGSSYQFE